MKSLFLSILFFLLAQVTSAQVPGYMGKRLSFFYEADFFIRFDHTYPTGINWRNDFAADYTVSKSLALGGSLKIISTCLYDFTLHDYDNYDTFHGDVKISGPAFSVYVKKFAFSRRGYLAPVGVYTKWELVYGKVSGKTLQSLPLDNSSSSQVNDIRDIVTRNPSVYGFIFSFGRQNLFLDKIFINTGGTIGIFPAGFKKLYGGESDDVNKDFARRAERPLVGYFLINFDFGIGLLSL